MVIGTRIDVFMRHICAILRLLIFHCSTTHQNVEMDGSNLGVDFLILGE